MHARSSTGIALAVALSAGATSTASAGGHGGGYGTSFRPIPAFRGGFGGRGGWGGGARPGGFRPLPPVAGIIHERSGGRPYFSAYGHTNTAAGFGRGVYSRYGAFGGRRRGFVGGGFGGFGYGLGAGTYGAPGIYGDAGVYGGQGTYGTEGTYGQPGTYGGTGTYATQSVYGNLGDVPYRSETPLAVRFAEPPLGPSPYAPYSPADRYAYAVSEDVRPGGPRVIHVHRAARADCACGSRLEPVILPYGIGTAY